MKTFTLTDQYTIVCTWENTRYGFRHLAHLIRNGREIDKAKVCYYNRTWESYEYQSVVHRLIEKHFDKDMAKLFMGIVDKYGHEHALDGFKGIAGLLALADVFGQDTAQSNRMKKATLASVPGIEFPKDFDSLPEDVKKERFAEISKMIGGK